jgi:sphingomyelin phosphodiesterase acid-like 3
MGSVRMRGVAWLGIAASGLLAAGLSAGLCAGAQVKPVAGENSGTVEALFLSDIHFEPFFDPGKAAQLAAAPVSDWKGILAAAPLADREQRFAALEQTCHTRGEDTSYPLLESSLRAIHTDAAGAKFVTVSGDLISHAFTCKFGAVFPKAAAEDYRAFVQKTLDFLVSELGSTLPGVPVYWALGNNDSDCGDYKLDPHSDFLAATGQAFAEGFPAAERKAAQETFAAGGYYNVRLPAPMRNARLLVLDDQFMGNKYETCGGKEDKGPAEAQIAWLTQQLAEARRNKEKVWVMAHIPPGVDVHSTATHMDQVCGGKGPKMFLDSERIAEVLVDFSDVVQLAIFAHTHMDEVRLLRAENGAPGSGPGSSASGSSASGSGVAVKMVSSISPINGNAPSFTLATVDSATAALKDFRVFAASNATGVDSVWHEEYDWDRTYHQSEFSASSLSKVIAGFEADPGAKTDASQAYIKDFFVGSSPLLGLVWPQYVCGLENDSAQAYKACVCPAAK